MDYTIGSKTYTQGELVLGQYEQLLNVQVSVDIGSGVDAFDSLEKLIKGVDAGTICAILLTEKGKRMQDKDIALFGKELRFSMTPKQVTEVISDFFVCNPVEAVITNMVSLAGSLNDLHALIYRT